MSKQRDWFWFLNGIEADLSAADYRLRPGDVEWWDFRSWQDEMREPIVVGAFPEPFLHGYGGPPRPTVVRYEPGLEQGARAIGRLLNAVSIRPVSDPAPKDANVFYTVRGTPRFTASLRDTDGAAGSPVEFTFAGDATGLAADPTRFRFRYQVPVSAVPAAALLAALAAVALIADRAWVVAAIAVTLLVVCLRAPRERRWLYLAGTLGSALSVFLLSPLVSHTGTHVLWAGPKLP